MSFRKRVQEYTDAQTKRTYQGEWAVSTYEPYQMEALSIVSLIHIINDVHNTINHLKFALKKILVLMYKNNENSMHENCKYCTFLEVVSS